MRLSILVVLFAGCTKSFLVVPDAQWVVVPPTQRATMEADHAAKLARLEQERAAASTALAEARRTAPKPAIVSTAAPAPGDRWAAAIRELEHSKQAALIDISQATAIWQRARIAYYQSRLEVATTAMAVEHCAYEVERARAIDRNLLGSDTYDSAPYRAQLSEAQRRWYAADQRAATIRDELTAAASAVTQTKDVYAKLVRNGPLAPTSADDRLRLAGFHDEPLRVKPAGIRARHATRHYLKLDARIANR